MTLLALADLGSRSPWAQASAPLRGVTVLMAFIADNYRDRAYAPNTRDTIRRFTLHQFVGAGLVLVEAVASHGPMNPKRVAELKALFDGCSAWLVFVTALPDSATFTKYAPDIAWETEVWVAADPDHMIHFNGERFLGPYPPQ